MKTKILLTVLLSFVFYLLSSQIPQGFNYQAIARGSDGKEIINTTLQAKISILSDTTGFYATGAGTYIWEEQQSVTTNSLGLFTLVLGNPSATKIQGSAATFSAISWTATPLFIGTKIFYQSNWKIMGSAKLWTVPYSMVSATLAGPLKKLAVTGETSVMDEALFEVKNKTGQTVFAVYNEGVRVYVDDGIAKGTKGGFAVGGFGTAKALSQSYFVVSPDSIRAYINDNPTKASKGGFAVGGFDKTKGGNINFLNVATDAGGIINPSQNRVLWYPLKNAFLAGKVLIEKPDSVGINSFATGYESKAIGQYSQAMGYQAVARGNYSTAIGKNAVANKINSFAFGDQSAARGNNSYALGSGAQAIGIGSFALGSVGVDSLGNYTGQTTATGDYAFALGFGSKATNLGAFAFGVNNSASGPFSTALGYLTTSEGAVSTTMGGGTYVEPAGWFGTATGVFTKAGNYAAAAFGDHTYASGHTSFATGFRTTASGHLSSTFGDQSVASGYGSVSMGYNTTAQSYASLVIGRYNILSGLSNEWNIWDPVFVIGNGSSSAVRSNAMTVYKNGIGDFGWFINLNSASTSTGVALKVNDDEALWYDGTCFSWGFGGVYNYFADKVTIGNAANPGYMLYVQGSAYSTGGWAGSDMRWKKNIQPINNDINDLLRLKGYKYEWRTDEYPDMNFDSDTHIGLLAQEVEKIYPEMVRTDSKGFKAVSYEMLSVLLLEGMKKQQAEIESQNQKILRLEKLVEQLMPEKGLK